MQKILALNDNFIKNRGSLPWPVDKGYVLCILEEINCQVVQLMDINRFNYFYRYWNNVKSVFDGTVSNVVYIDDMQVVIIQHGKYFTTYSNLGSVSVQRGSM